MIEHLIGDTAIATPVDTSIAPIMLKYVGISDINIYATIYVNTTVIVAKILDNDASLTFKYPKFLT